MAVSIRFKPAGDLDRKLGELALPMMTALGFRVETEAKRRAPVKTGNLRRSIVSSVAEIDGVPVAIVAATAFYAGFVELGTVKMSPRPFLRPALLSVLSRGPG